MVDLFDLFVRRKCVCDLSSRLFSSVNAQAAKQAGCSTNSEASARGGNKERMASIVQKGLFSRLRLNITEATDGGGGWKEAEREKRRFVVNSALREMARVAIIRVCVCVCVSQPSGGRCENGKPAGPGGNSDANLVWSENSPLLHCHAPAHKLGQQVVPP